MLTLPLIGGCGEQMARVEDNQVKLQAMVAANARQLATLSSQVHTGQKDVQEGIEKLDRNDKDVTGEIRLVQTEQGRLGQAVARSQQTLGRQAELLRENQELLKDGVAQIADVAQGTASDVTAIARGQATLRQMVRGNGEASATRMAGLADSQQKIQTGIGQLHEADRALADQIEVVSSKHDLLHQTVQDSDAGAQERLAALTAAQAHTRSDIEGLRSLAEATAQHADAMSSKQAALNAALDRHAGALADTLSTVEHEQRGMRSAIDTVSTTTRQTAEGLTALAAAHNDLTDTAAVNHRVVAGQLSAAARSQQELSARISTVDEKVDRQTDQLGDIAVTQETVQKKLAADNETINAKLADLSANQTQTHRGLSRLVDKADRLAGDVAAASAERTAMNETMVAANGQLTDHMTELAQNDRALQASIDSLGDKADTIRADIATVSSEQAAMSERLHATDQTVIAKLTDLSQQQAGLHDDIATVQTQTTALACDVTAVKGQQLATHEKIEAGHEGLASQASALSERQHVLDTRLSILSDKADALTAGVAAHKSLMADNTALAHEVVAVSKTQQTIGADLARLDGKADRLMTDVRGLADGQGSLGRTLQTQAEATDRQMTAMASNQQNLQAGLDTLTALSGQTALDVMTVADAQADLKNTVRLGDESLNRKVATLANAQQVVQTSVDALTERAGQMAADVVSAKAAQAALHQSLMSHNDRMQERAAALADSHATLRSGIDTVTATAGQTALDLAAMDARHTKLAQGGHARIGALEQQTEDVSIGLNAVAAQQAELSKIVETGNAALVGQIDTMADSQEVLQNNVARLNETAQDTAADVVTMAADQKALGRALAAHNGEATGQFAKLARGQSDMGSQIDTLTATTGQTALDLSLLADAHAQLQRLLTAGVDSLAGQNDRIAGEIGALTAEQAALADSLKGHDESIAGRVSKLAADQREIHLGLDTMSTTASQLTQALGSMSKNQANIEKTVTTSRDELTARLDAFARDQQQWQKRFDATQTQIQTLSANLSAVEQRVATMQGSLQTSLEGLLALVAANTEQRIQFENTVSQSVEDMTSTVTRLQQAHSALREQLDLIEEGTQSQADDIIAAIERLTRQSAELKVSNAETELEPTIVDAAK